MFEGNYNTETSVPLYFKKDITFYLPCILQEYHATVQYACQANVTQLAKSLSILLCLAAQYFRYIAQNNSKDQCKYRNKTFNEIQQGKLQSI